MNKVLAKSDETGEVAYKEVVGLFQKQADEIYYVHIGDEIIEVTGEHPFWLDGKGWTLVKDLKVGELLVSSDGIKLAIDKIEKELREAIVYNFRLRILILISFPTLVYGFITVPLQQSITIESCTPMQIRVCQVIIMFITHYRKSMKQ